MIQRRKTRQIQLGKVQIGGDAPITVQSMTKTDTRDARATVQQIWDLEAAGCEIVRCAVPVREAADLVHASGGLLHCDASQAPGRIALDLSELGADLLTLSAHKMGGALGAGALVLKGDLAIAPMLIGVVGRSLDAANHARQDASRAREQAQETAARYAELQREMRMARGDGCGHTPDIVQVLAEAMTKQKDEEINRLRQERDRFEAEMKRRATFGRVADLQAEDREEVRAEHQRKIDSEASASVVVGASQRHELVTLADLNRLENKVAVVTAERDQARTEIYWLKSANVDHLTFISQLENRIVNVTAERDKGRALLNDLEGEVGRLRELVRHRAGWGYSQLSQRYVDESHAAFVMPPAIAGDAELERARSSSTSRRAPTA